MLPRRSTKRGRDARPRAAPAGAPSRSRRARRREVGERRADERVARVAALGHGREHEPGGRRRRQILGRVHREVGAAVEHGLLHFLHEHARARRSRGSARLGAVAGGLDDDELDSTRIGRRSSARRRARPASVRARCRASRCAATPWSRCRSRSNRSRARRRRARRAACRRRPSARTVGSCSSLLTMPCVSASTAARSVGVELVELGANRSSSPSRTSSAQLAQRGDERRDLARGERSSAVALDLVVDDDLADLADLAPARSAEPASANPCRSSMSSSVTSLTSRTPGSTSRGTATSTTSSGRPRRARHHHLERRALDEHVRRPVEVSSTSTSTSVSAISVSGPPGRRAATASVFGAVAACGWRRRRRRRRAPQRDGQALAHLAGADHEHPRAVERAEALGGHRDRGRRHRSGARGRCRSRCAPACRLDRVAEQPVERRAAVPSRLRRLPRVADLAEDLGSRRRSSSRARPRPRTGARPRRRRSRCRGGRRASSGASAGVARARKSRTSPTAAWKLLGDRVDLGAVAGREHARPRQMLAREQRSCERLGQRRAVDASCARAARAERCGGSDR